MNCTDSDSQTKQHVQAVQSLATSLEEAAKDGYCDMTNIRAILLEYAALHALRVMPDMQAKMVAASAHALSEFEACTWMAPQTRFHVACIALSASDCALRGT
jgi:hypothetical protein